MHFKISVFFYIMLRFISQVRMYHINISFKIEENEQKMFCKKNLKKSKRERPHRLTGITGLHCVFNSSRTQWLRKKKTKSRASNVWQD